VLVALGMVAICGMMALAVDAGQLYFARRFMQNAVDAGALAGAQELVGTNANPTGNPASARYQAMQETFKSLGLTPTNGSGSSFYNATPISDVVGGYTVTVSAPIGYDSKQVKVTAQKTAPTSFAKVLGIATVLIGVNAVAEAGTDPKTYALFAFQSGGSGNTILDDQNGYAQIDDGQDGADVCTPSLFGTSVSNAKFHVPNPNQASLNVNGDMTVNQASDNHALFTFWVSPVAFGSGIDPQPDYFGPDTSSITPTNPGRTHIAPGNSQLIANYTAIGGSKVTITNSTAQDYYIYVPGKYTQNLSIPWNMSGDAKNSVYIFLNGIYYFVGANLTTTGGYIANTSDGLPHYNGSDGVTDLPAAADGTNGVEFVMDTTSTYSASNSDLAGAGSVFFVAPSLIPTGTQHLAFYFPKTNTVSGTVWSETFDASTSANPRYQVWGTVYSAGASSSMTLTGVELGPHNTIPYNGLAGSAAQYAINGEFIAPDLRLQNGNVLGNTPGSTATCPAPGTIVPGTPGLLVQFNIRFAPAPGVNSYLIQ